MRQHMTDNRFPCRTAPSLKKSANVLRKPKVTDLTEAETLEDARKQSLLVPEHVAVAAVRANWQ
jgi:hypothetical protein